ncbi:MAG: cache domain-containing protein [Pseudomonadota bacterium]
MKEAMEKSSNANSNASSNANSNAGSAAAGTVSEREDGAQARAAILARRVAALEAVVAIERRLRHVQEMAHRGTSARLAAQEAQADKTVPRPGAAAAAPYDDDATIPVPGGRPPQYMDAPGTPAAPAPHPVRAQRAPSDRSVLAGAASPLALAPGFELFEYRIDAVLGQGGFGITYLATDVHLNVKVAIKEYLPGDYALRASDKSVAPRWPEDAAFYQSGLESFLVEARTLATFRHSNIVRVARFFEANRTAYMVLEYERGKPLKQWWQGRKNMAEQELLGLMQPLLDGLSVVHAAGYLHRDIKPDNIYVRKEDGSLVLLDFGAARLTVGTAHAMADVVTPGYAPPEQYQDGDQGPWTDIYALGATLYWMITGAKPPAAPERISGAEMMVPAAQAGRGRYSDAFLAAIDWALHIDPAKRPRSVQQFVQTLYASHAGSLVLQDALKLGENEAHVGTESLRMLLDSPRLLRRRALQMGRAVLRPASWPMVLKMTIAMVLAALLPMVITAYYNLNGSMAAVQSSELRNLERLAQSTAGRVSQLVEDSDKLAMYLTTDGDFLNYLSEPNAARKELVETKLANLIKSNPDVHLMFLIDPDGTALVSSEPGVAGRNFKFREYFQQAMAGHAFKTGIIVGTTAGQPGMYYSNPVFDAQHKLIGVVVLRIKGPAIGAIVDEMAAGSGRTPFMIDGDGVLIHHPDPHQLYRSLAPLPAAAAARIAADQRFRRMKIDSANMPALARAMMGAKRAGNISYFSTISGGEEHAGYAPVPGHNWVVGVTESRQTFEAPLRLLFMHVLYSVAVVGLVFLILAVLFARSIVRPIARLTEAANALKDGDYDRANIKVTSTDEIGRLARTFNVMIDVLRQRDREKRRGQLGRHDGAQGDDD